MIGAEASQRIAAFLARADVADVLRALDGAGEETRVVGGAVRNLLLGEPAADLDLATTALPKETIARSKAAGFKTIPTGIAHGTVTLVKDGTVFEITTLRRDVETDGRHAQVAFGRDFAADALRRDFTINAFSLDAEGRVHDVCGGLGDLAARRVRFIGEAKARITEDYLRILRFFRFHARYGGDTLDAEGFEACIAGRAGLAGLSRERICAEMLKLVVAPRASDALAAMATGGLLLPLLGCVPHLSRFQAVADGAGGDSVFRLAALAVDIGEDALRLREKLRLSNEAFERIARLAGALEALSGRTALPCIATLRHLADRFDRDAVADALVLANTHRGNEIRDEVARLTADFRRTPAFLPGGRDVLAHGIAAGPAVGLVLAQARWAWIEAGCPADKLLQAKFLASAVDQVLKRVTAT